MLKFRNYYWLFIEGMVTIGIINMVVFLYFTFFSFRISFASPLASFLLFEDTYTHQDDDMLVWIVWMADGVPGIYLYSTEHEKF